VGVARAAGGAAVSRRRAAWLPTPAPAATSARVGVWVGVGGRVGVSEERESALQEGV